MPKKRKSSKSPKNLHSGSRLQLPMQSIGGQVTRIAYRSKQKFLSFLKAFHQLSYRTKALFIFGILFISISLIWHFNQTIQLAFFTPKVIPVEKTHAVPTQLIIKKVQMDLLIEQTAIINGIWQVSEHVSHLTTSARPNEQGPIILYGHNTTDKLGPIRWLAKGDTIEVKTADRKTHSYTINETMTVSPDRLDVFTKRAGETLIIYTCDGFADLQRFVLIAVPKQIMP